MHLCLTTHTMAHTCIPLLWYIGVSHLCAPLAHPLTDLCLAVMMSDTEVTRGYHNWLSEQFGSWVFECSHQSNSGQKSHSMLNQHPHSHTNKQTHAHTHAHMHTHAHTGWSCRFCISGLNPSVFFCFCCFILYARPLTFDPIDLHLEGLLDVTELWWVPG